METGSGPAVLLVHGLGGFKEGWGHLPADLAEAGLRAVAVDLPGTGDSPRLAHGRHTPMTLAASLGPIVCALAPVAVVGHSLGAQVALLAALARPDPVRRLALLAPAAAARPRRFPPRRPADVLQLPLVGTRLGRLVIGRLRRDPQRRRAAFMSAAAEPGRLHEDPALAALLDLGADRLRDADLGAMVEWARAGLALDLRPLARRVGQPALVVTGALDGLTPPALAADLAARLPAGRLLEVPGVAHFPHFEARETVTPALVRHLAPRSPDGRPA